MKKNTKFLSIVMLAFVLVLTACSSNDEAELDTDEKPVLTQLGFQRNFDPNEDPVAKFLEEATGYEVDYEILPVENYDDTLNLKMSNKEEIDIVKMSGSQYHKLASEGALEPLDDLLEEYGETLVDVNDDPSWEAAKVDGEIFGIPEKAPKPFVGGAIGIRQDILEDLGIENPDTLDEFYELLVTIKEETDMIPMTGFQPIVQTIAGAFGFNAEWADIDGEIVPRVAREGMSDYIEFMQKLYAEDLIDSEWPINDHTIARDKFTAGQAAIMGNYGWGAASQVVPVFKDDFDTKVELIMGVEGENGQKGAWVEATGVSWFIGIPKASKHKEHAMNYLNMKVQPEIFKEMTIGNEGEHWEYDENDLRVPIMPAFNDEKNSSDWFMTSSDTNVYGDYWILRTRKDKDMGEAFNQMLDQVEYGEEDATVFAPPLESISKYGQRLNNMESDYIINAIADPDSADSYEEFLEKWNAEGGEEATKEYNEWYADFKQ